jgi:hypothetical protein
MLIGLTGKRLSGKDTCGDYICENFNYKRYAFADPLKKAVQNMFDFSDEQLYSEKKEEKDIYWDIEPRRVLQIFGTDIVRNLFPKYLLPKLGNNFWIKRFEIWYEKNKNPTGIIVTDLRFQNEIDIIKKLGGIVIKIKREGGRNKSEIDKHESENIEMLENIDYKINNDSTKEELYKKINYYIDMYHLESKT